MDIKNEVLALLEVDAKLSTEEIAVRLETKKEKIEKIIKDFEEKKIIMGYRTIVNRNLVDKDIVTALIEVRTSPQRGRGFDKIAKRIYSFPEVMDCSLVSGGYDLLLVVKGRTLNDIATFVSDKIAPLESVLSTQTHFILKKYKSDGTVFEYGERADREAIVL